MNHEDDTLPADAAPETRVYALRGEAPPTLPPDEIPLARPVTPINPLLLLDMSAGKAVLQLVLLLGGGAVIMVLASVAYFAFGAGDLADGEHIAASDALILTLFMGLGLIGVVIAIVKLMGGTVASIGLTKRSLGMNLLLGPPVAIASYLAFLICAGMLQFVWPEGFRQLGENPERIKDMVPDSGFVPLMLLMLGIGLYEEVVFRGFLLTRIRRLTRSWTLAILITSLGFAAMHIGNSPGSQTMATAIPLFAVAVLWSLVTVWRRSVVVSIVGHALFNVGQVMVLRAIT